MPPDNKWDRVFPVPSTAGQQRRVSNSMRKAANELFREMMRVWLNSTYDTGVVFRVVFHVKLEDKVPRDTRPTY